MKTRLRGVFERPRGSDVWWINYRDGAGKRHREKIGRRKLAIEVYHRRKAEILEGRFSPSRPEPGPRFRELAAERMNNKKVHLAPRSYRTDQIRLRPLLNAFGELEGKSITPEMIDLFLAALVERGLSPSTANRYRSLLSNIFRLAVRNRRVTENPCARVQRFKEIGNRVRFLSAEEEQAIRSAIQAECPEREPEFDLALHTGMRRGEQFGLKWEGVDLERGILTVYGKTGRRFVPVNSVAARALGALKRRDAGGDFVCAEVKREGQQDWRRWFEKCVRAAGVSAFRWHDLRHTFASRLVMAGVDIRSVQELLGHKSILMTMRYAHLSQSHQQANVERLAEPIPEQKGPYSGTVPTSGP